jgi:hypothetical protein
MSQRPARGGALAGGIAGVASAPGSTAARAALPADEAASPEPSTYLRGQIFRVGASLASAISFLVGGFSMAIGVDELTAVVMAMSSCLVIVVLSFFAELILEPSLERVAVQREEDRKEREREQMPLAGGLMASGVTLTGGLIAAPAGANSMGAALPPLMSGGAAGRAKGRTLDITLPEETAVALEPRATSEEDFQDLASLLREAVHPSPAPVRVRQ